MRRLKTIGWTLLVATTAVLAMLPPAFAWDPEDFPLQADRIPSYFPLPSHLIIVGDMHGDFDAMLSILLRMGVINSEGHWMAQDAHLVIDGDWHGKGDDARLCADLQIRLSAEAADVGGRLVHIIGNWEAKLVSGEISALSADEIDSYAEFKDPKGNPDAKARRKAGHLSRKEAAVLNALRTVEPYASFYRQSLGGVQYGGIRIHHGSLPKALARMDLGRFNATVRAEIARRLGSANSANTQKTPDELPKDDKTFAWVLDSPDSPVHNRIFADKITADFTAKIFRDAGISYYVQGHTPTGSADIKFAHGVFFIDTGISLASRTSKESGGLSALSVSWNGTVTPRDRLLPVARPLLDALREREIAARPKCRNIRMKAPTQGS